MHEIRQAPERPISRAFGLVFPDAEQIRLLSPQDRKLATLLAREAGEPLPPGLSEQASWERPATPIAAPATVTPLDDEAVLLGAAGAQEVGIDLAKLLDGRLLVQGTSGAGKSWTLRRIIERTYGMVQQVIIDPEGEFRSLSERYDHVVVEAHKLDPAALGVLGARIRAHRFSVLLDMSELDRDGQLQAIASFFEALINAPRAHWTPCLIVIDEAHLFAPFGGQVLTASSVRKAAIGAVVDLMSRGRKRGLAGVLATQRLARLAKSVVSEVHNFLVGMNTLDLDIRRAAETIGWDASRAFEQLPKLAPGDFIAVGPAFSQAPIAFRVGHVETQHRGARPEFAAPASVDPSTAAALLELDSLMEATAEDEQIRDENALVPGLKAVRAYIRDPAAPLAGRIFEELVPLAPDGARIADMPAAFERSSDEFAAAIALLDEFGALDFVGEGADRAVRIEKGMLACL